jgi:hypothetical protein
VYVACFNLLTCHYQACSIKTHTNIFYLGSSNVDPYYAVGSYYYLAYILLDNVNNFVCKVLILQDFYKWLGINKTYQFVIKCVLRIDINVKELSYKVKISF